MTRGRPAGVRAAIGTALVAGGVLLAGRHLAGLLAPGRWWWLTVGAVLVLAVVTAAVRALARRRHVGSLAAAGLSSVGALLLWGGLLEGAGPGPVDTVTGLVRQGVDAVVTGVAPVPVTPGLELLVVSGLVAAFLLAELLAVGLGRAGPAGVVLAAIWVAPVSFGRPVAPGAVVLGGAAFLLLLWATAPGAARPVRGQRGTGAVELGAVAVAVVVATLALVAGPLATSSPYFATVRLPGSWGPGLTGPVTLGTEPDLLSSLTPRSNRTVLTYTTTSRDVGPLRTHTLVDFDGTAWATTAPGDLESTDGLLWPRPAPPIGEEAEVLVRVGGMNEDRLPLSTEPRAVDLPDAWWYDPTRDEVVGRGTTTLDLTYRMRFTPRDLSAETLRTDQPTPLPGTAPELGVPSTSHAQDVAALAREVTEGASSAYDQALALQSWFRDASRFRYATQIPPAETDDAVWDFLERRSGYCVQYATAMTVMARSLGIPARMAIGFLPGRPIGSEPDTFVVAARLAHAWPELWFADAGWVRFEPTPAVQSGTPPTYADPFLAAPTTAPTTSPDEVPTATPSTAPSTDTEPTGAGAGAAGEQEHWPLALGIGASGLLVTLVGAILVRRRRGPAPLLGPELAWSSLRTAAAGQGVEWSDAVTPRQAARTIQASWPPLAPSVVTGTAPAALTALVAAVERERYGPVTGGWSAMDLDAWAEAATLPWREVSPGRPVGGPTAPRAD